jgi:hypothetical protein
MIAIVMLELFYLRFDTTTQQVRAIRNSAQLQNDKEGKNLRVLKTNKKKIEEIK